MRSTSQRIRALPSESSCNERVFAWAPGSVAPFTSLWMVLQRFTLLNVPSRSVMISEFGLSGAKDADPTLGGAARWSRSHSDDLAQRLAFSLGEPLSAFRYSTINAYPDAVKSLFHFHRRFCPDCLNEGFHTVLFSLKGLSKCPYHRSQLMTCRYCSRLERIGDLGSVVSHPGRCACGYRYLDCKAARKPEENLQRTQSLKALSDYLESISRFVWFHMPGMINSVPPDFASQLQFWAKKFSVPVPARGWIDIGKMARAPTSSSRYCTSIGLTKALVREPKPVLQTVHDSDAELTAIFKSIKRYILRNVLDVQVRAVNALAMSQDSNVIEKVLRSCPQANKAWMFLLWWQACVRSVSLRDWFRRRRPIYLYGESKGVHIDERSPLSLSGSEVKWVEHHLFVSHLKMTWVLAEHQHLMRVPHWGWSIASRSHHGQLNAAPLWSHARDASGMLTMWIDDGPLQWPCVKTRAHVRVRLKKGDDDRKREIAAVSVKQCIWFNAITKEWSTERGPQPSCDLDFRERTLFLPDPEPFILVGVTESSGERWFAARCLGLPLASRGDSTVQAIASLKYAVNAFRKDVAESTKVP